MQIDPSLEKPLLDQSGCLQTHLARIVERLDGAAHIEKYCLNFFTHRSPFENISDCILALRTQMLVVRM